MFSAMDTMLMISAPRNADPKAVHLKVRCEQPADEAKQQRVDDQREQAERENQQRQRQEHQNRPDEGVENAQQQRRDESASAGCCRN